MRDIILASASPRRREIMDKLHVRYRVVVSNVSERMPETGSPEEKIRAVAYQKADAVFAEHPEELIVAADTVVEIDGEILGKPHSMSQARKMLEKLSGRTHRVITALVMRSAELNYSAVDVTAVTFAPLESEEIERYIQTREPYDKAGAYAIQGWASVFITAICGNYYTVMGLPLPLVYQKLRELGYYLAS